jgi:putrescine transport system ATP-binding protein
MSSSDTTRPLWQQPGADPFIRISQITKNFSDVTAVDNVSLDIFRGELFCLLGGSGCGKTTLLRMLAGFETPTSGTIEIDGLDMSQTPPHQRPTNMMFQSYALFPHMSVEKNIGYGLKQDKTPKAEITQRVEEALALVQLEQMAKRKPHQLSGGQRQRVALARALIKRPKLLLLDEPLGALDKKLRERTQFELVNIQEKLGITFVVVTHDQEEAMTLATRIGVMDAGRIVQVGEPHAIYEAPQTKFVADFIGSINIFEGGIDGTHFVSGTARLTLPATHPDAAKYYAIRPEKISISRQSTGLENEFQGRVEDIAYLGNQSVYVVEIDGGKHIRVIRTNRERGLEAPITWDDPVHIGWPAPSSVVLAQ